MMNNLFEDLKKSAVESSKVIANATRNAIQKTREEVDIQKIKFDINKVYKQIGVLIYKEAQGEIDDPSDEINHLVQEIQKKMKLIQNIKIAQNVESGEVEVKEDDCEEKIIIEPNRNEEGLFVMRFCKNCNVGNHPDSTHCINCGARLK